MTMVMPIHRWQLVGKQSKQIEDATFQDMKSRNKIKKKKSRDTLEKEKNNIKELREKYWPTEKVNTYPYFELGLTQEEEDECKWFIQCIYIDD